MAGSDLVPVLLLVGLLERLNRRWVTATVTNRLKEDFPDGRVTFVLPAGEYQVEGGRLETAVVSDDGLYTLLTARVDMPAERTVGVTALREAPD